MSKSKDRLMLEKIFNAAADSGIYEEFCSDGREVLKDLANHLGRPLSKICGDPVEISLKIYTNDFIIDDVFDSEDLSDDPEEEFNVEVFVTRKNKRIKVDVNSVEWYD